MYLNQSSLQIQTKQYLLDLQNRGKLSQKQIQESRDPQKIINSLKAIGVLRMNWFNQRKQIKSYSYGTAFAIAPNLIMTCLHNIYSQILQKFCDQAIFIPNINVGYLGDNSRMYKVTKTQFIRYKIPSRTLMQYPLQEELVLMYLEKEIKLDYYMKIGLLSNKPQYRHTDCLTIIGYPSSDFRDVKIFSRAYCKRQIRKGGLHEIDGHIIKYNIDTQIGMSGSPVLFYNEMRQYVVIGIHTHSGKQKGYNSGLFFNSDVLQSVLDYVQDLNKNIKVDNKIQTKFMQIIIYYYLFYQNYRDRRRYNILSPKIYKIQKQIQAQYYNFAQEQNIQQDQQERHSQELQQLINIIRKLRVASDIQQTAAASVQYQDDQYENTSVICNIFDKQQLQLNEQCQGSTKSL